MGERYDALCLSPPFIARRCVRYGTTTTCPVIVAEWIVQW
jgi:hypothetical protein